MLKVYTVEDLLFFPDVVDIEYTGPFGDARKTSANAVVEKRNDRQGKMVGTMNMTIWRSYVSRFVLADLSPSR